jgi:hypothetical protein
MIYQGAMNHDRYGNQSAGLLSDLLKTINNLYNLGVLADLRKLVTEFIKKFQNEGMYRVL